MEIRRNFDILDRLSDKFDKLDLFAVKRNGKWDKLSCNQYISDVQKFSLGLLKLNVGKGDKIVTISNNRPEWNIMDMGIAQVGAIHVPIYPNIGSESLSYVLKHSEAKILIVASEKFYSQVKPIIEKASNIEKIYSFEDIEGVDNWQDIINLGKQNTEQHLEKLENVKASIKPEDVCSIIYTSGTTGVPKGVVIHHSIFADSIFANLDVLKLANNEVILSFLPLCHMYERIVNYFYQYKGCLICYAESTETIVSDMNEVNPVTFTSVPRVLEKIYDKIILKGKSLKGSKKVIFFWAVNLGLRYELNNANGWFYALKLKIANKLVFYKWREALGNKLRYVISSGAALQPRLARIFTAIGIVVQEGYGLTETSVLTVNGFSYPDLQFDTVGKVLNNVKIKIAEDGEILAKGWGIMKSYFKDEEATKKAIDTEGWFHTGDIGVLDDRSVLRIIDRKKSMFKLSTGKYIAPQIIENKIKESPFVEQIIVLGENEKFTSALICPAYEYLHSWCTLHDITFENNKELIENPQVIARVQKDVSDFNEELGQHEQLKKFHLIEQSWSVETGELSPTLKLRRNFITKKYEDIIKNIYNYNKLS